MGSHRVYRERKYEFGKQLLTYRTRVSLTQHELAAQIHVHRRSVQNWETGESYPKTEALQRLITVFLRNNAFTQGDELAEAEALWQQADADGTQALVPFNQAWFARTLAIVTAANTTAANTAAAIPTTAHNKGAPYAHLQPQFSTIALPQKPRVIIDWGEAIAIPTLYGRERDSDLLQQWVVDDRCRVITLLGLGGIGKSSLAITLAQQVLPHFDVVMFRSLQNGPPLAQVLDQVIRAVSDQQSTLPELLPDKLALLVQLFRQRRCLLILDNLETILQSGALSGTYRAGYADYGMLLQALGEREHQSCLLLTSREKPAELGPLEGRTTPVRTMHLTGLADSACRTILEAKDIVGSATDLRALTQLYGGNPLALTLVSEPIRELFGGNVGAFLATGDAFFNGVGKLLEQQFARSTLLEQTLLYWLAIERELVPFQALLADVGESVPQREVLAALESLRRRMQMDRSPDRPAFTLQPLILEYVTDQLVHAVCQEIVEEKPWLLQRHALVQATTKEYVRRSQERLIAMPLLEQLIAACGGTEAVEQRLSALLTLWRGQPHAKQGYGPGNIINLLRLLRKDVVGMDFSHLMLQQIYLQGVAAHNTSLADSHLVQSVFQEPFAGIESVACSPDMRYLAVGTVNGEIRLWEVASRTTHVALQAHDSPVVGLALSADGQLLVSGSADGTVRLWDVASGTNLAILKGHSTVVWSVALSNDGRLLASGSGDGSIRIWDARARKCVAVLEEHTSAVRSVAISMDGYLLASGSFDGTVRLWDISMALDDSAQSPSCLAILTGHTNAVRSVSLSADGRLVASGSVDCTVRLWDTLEVLRADLWADTENPPCLAVLKGHTDVIRSVVLSADGRLVVSGSGDGTVRLWDVASSLGGGSCLAILQGHTNAIMSMGLAADGQLLASGSTDGTVRLWEVSSATCLTILEGHTNAIMSVALTTDGQLLASGSTDGTVRLWDTSTNLGNLGQGANLTTLHGHTNMVMSVAFSQDGRLLATGGGDGIIQLWDVSNARGGGIHLATLKGHTNVVRNVAWSADGRLLASASYDGTIRLWDAHNGTHLTTLHGHTNMVMSVAFSQDGRLLASGGFDETVRLWDTSKVLDANAQSPTCLAILRDHKGVVFSVSLSAEGQWLASCSFDRTVRVWDTTAIFGAELGAEYDPERAPISSHIILESETSEAWSVALSPDGNLLVSGSTDGMVRLWDLRNSLEDRPSPATMPGHSRAIWSVALSADGRLLASGSGDGTVRLWNGSDATPLRILRAARPYEQMDITGLTGITEAQRASLIALGAVERNK